MKIKTIFCLGFVWTIMMTQFWSQVSGAEDSYPDCMPEWMKLKNLTTQKLDPSESEAELEEDYEPVELSVEEYRGQQSFYLSKSVNDIIGLCRDETTGKYDFTASDCVANNISLAHGADDHKINRLRQERRVLLCETISKVKSFKVRLETPTETIIQFGLFLIALIGGLFLLGVGHFRFKTMYDSRSPDPTKGWPFWVYQKMNYYVVPVGKEVKGPSGAKAAEKLAQTAAKERELEIDDVIDSEDEKEDVFQTAAAVTEYNDFWNIFQGQNAGDADKKKSN